jgi:hypothetical protein
LVNHGCGNHLRHVVSGAAKASGAREYDGSLSWRPFDFALTNKGIDPIDGCSVIVVGSSKDVHIIDRLAAGLFASILVFNDNRSFGIELKGFGGLRISWTNPSSLASNHVVLGCFGAINGGLGLFTSSLGELSIGFDHLVGLSSGSLHLRQLALHGRELFLHDAGLDFRVVTSNEDSSDAYAGSNPQTYGLSEFEPKFYPLQTEGQSFNAAVKGIGALCLIFDSLVSLCYSLQRADYVLTVGVLGGFLPLAFSIFLLPSVFSLIHWERPHTT